MTTLSPQSESEAAEAVLAARSGGTPLSIRGGGTRPLGRPVQSGMTLSTAALAGVTLYEPSEMVVGARAGTPLATIEALLAERGQQFAFEPMDHRALLGTAGEPTIGAVAAGNISGPRRPSAGAARDSLIGVRFVNGLGEVVKSGGRVMKNVTGLDLVKLQAGAFGTLGLLTEVVFKVAPRPETSATLRLEGLSDAEGIAALQSALNSPFEVTGAAHLPGGLDGPRSATLIRLEGFAASVEGRLASLAGRLGAAAADGLQDAESRALWLRIRDASALAGTAGALWRVSLRPTAGPGFVRSLGEGLARRWFYDWGGGLVWLEVAGGEDAGADRVRAAAAAAGGHALLVRAPEPLRAGVAVFEPPAPALRPLVERIRRAVDPDGLFNPGLMGSGS